jgi:dipeptidyl aminopeptidase/acylaminoacyl peptidase
MMSLARNLTVLSVICLALVGCGQQSGVETARYDGPPNLIARQELFGNPDRAGVKISPDGSQLSWLQSVDGVLNVWVAPVSDLSAAKPVTNDTSRGIRRYFWAYNNKHLIYLQDVGGDENWRAYSVNLSNSEITDLTPMEEVQVRIENVSYRRPGEILLAINNRDPRLHDIHRLNLETSELTLVEENPGYLGYVTDDNYEIRFAQEMVEGGGMKWHRRTIDGWEEFMDVSSDDALTTALTGFDKTGETIYLIDSRDRNTSGLFALDLKTNEAVLLYENDRADVDDAMIHPTEYTVQAASSTFKRREWEILDDSIKGDLEYLATVADGELDIIDRTLDDTVWIVGFELAAKPYSYYMYDREADKAEFLFSNREALKDETMANMHAEVIKSRDGMDLVSYLTLPVESDPDGDGRPTEAGPLVLFVHGGPWARDNWGYHPYHQWLANRGYAVLSVNYRGSTGLGKDFLNASTHEWAGKMHDDLIDAVNWAVSEGIANPEQIAIMGGSYGGYATLVGLTFTPDTFACGVDIVGPSNLITLIESIPPYWEPMLDLFASRVGDTRTEGGRTLLMERSPLTHAEKISKPLLIGQGANDPRVKQQEADQIVTAMQAKNIPVTYVLFPDEGHGFARPENRLAFNAVAESFLAECLGGRVEPIGDDFEGSSITVPVGAADVAGLEELLGTDEPAAETATEEEEVATGA